MAEVRWTEAQKQVIDVRDKNVLVAAAAGSGKTAVLVEHIISLVTGDNGAAPVDIDRLLVVTFTKAAASEMRERIHAALQEKAKENPMDDHIRKQLTYVHNAKITTIDSFCKDVVKEHFSEIDIDPAFKIADSGDLALLQSDVMSALLEENYAAGSEDFLRFVDVYSNSRSDSGIEDKILTLYRFSQSYPNPEKWLNSLTAEYSIGAAENGEGSRWFKAAKQAIDIEIDDCVGQADLAVSLSYELGDPKLEEFVKDEYTRLKRLADAEDYDGRGEAIRSFVYGRFPTLKGLSEQDTLLKDRIKDIRNSYKKAFESICKKYFSRPYEDIIDDVKACYPVVKELVRLVIEFGRRYRQAKLDKDMTDFSDVEHYALDILAKEDEHGAYIPTETAVEMAADYHEIMIDEYQDSNLVQEIILNAVSGRGEGAHNVFMVGDVKQSIYKFRLARPELFLEKFNTYPTDAETDCQKIVLSQNFRSRPEVLDFCNMIFRQVMVKGLGGIAYDEENMLYQGMDFPGSGAYKAEIMFIDSDETDEAEDGSIDEDAPANIELEAAMTVAKIKEMVEGKTGQPPLQIYDKQLKRLRDVMYKDIAILFRSTRGYVEAYTEVFMSEGVPVYTNMSEGYFDTFEISVILDMLSVIDNPRQDIKLTAVLRHIFGMTENMLADIRTDRKGSFYDAFSQYTGVYEKQVSEAKCKLLKYRDMATYMSIYDIICDILDATHFGEFLMAGKAGEKRMANIEMLLAKAKVYEEGAYSGLFNFVRYIELMKKYKVEQGEANLAGENDNSVKLMTIHKSKGLEYPVVFVAGMGKRMNMADASKDIIIHHDLGIGINRVDTDRRVKYRTLVKDAIGYRIKLENLAEELRVLYVALTRAREKLILTGVGKVAKKLDAYDSLNISSHMELDVATISGANSYMDWIIMSTVRGFAKDKVIFRRIKPADIVYNRVQTIVAKDKVKDALKHWDADKVYDGDIRKYLEDTFSYEYAHMEECDIRSKMSISDIKHMFMKLTADEDYPAEEIHFGEKGEIGPSKGALRGTAYHRVFELIDYGAAADTVEQVSEMLENMVERGLLNENSKSLVDVSKIKAFLDSDLGRRMRQAYHMGNLYREKPFVMGIPACKIEPDKYSSEELVVVQGIVDAWFIEDDGIVVVDYKTDSVDRIEDLIARYESQLVYYGEALSRITGMEIKERIIYSVKFDQTLKV